jgi:hypothetical protein
MTKARKKSVYWTRLDTIAFAPEIIRLFEEFGELDS